MPCAWRWSGTRARSAATANRKPAIALAGPAGSRIGVRMSAALVRYLTTKPGRSSLNWRWTRRILGFTAGLAVLTCVLFGLAPALKATHAAPARIISLAGRGLTATRERFSLRRRAGGHTSLAVASVGGGRVAVRAQLAQHPDSRCGFSARRHGGSGHRVRAPQSPAGAPSPISRIVAGAGTSTARSHSGGGYIGGADQRLRLEQQRGGGRTTSRHRSPDVEHQPRILSHDGNSASDRRATLMSATISNHPK